MQKPDCICSWGAQGHSLIYCIIFAIVSSHIQQFYECPNIYGGFRLKWYAPLSVPRGPVIQKSCLMIPQTSCTVTALASQSFCDVLNGWVVFFHAVPWPMTECPWPAGQYAVNFRTSGGSCSNGEATISGPTATLSPCDYGGDTFGNQGNEVHKLLCTCIWFADYVMVSETSDSYLCFLCGVLQDIHMHVLFEVCTHKVYIDMCLWIYVSMCDCLIQDAICKCLDHENQMYIKRHWLQ